MQTENVKEVINNLACTALRGSSPLDVADVAMPNNTIVNSNYGNYTYWNYPSLDVAMQNNTIVNSNYGNYTYWNYPYWNYLWWPVYWPQYLDDRMTRAFRVAKVLVDKKVIKLQSIAKFVDLVDEIAKVV